MKTPRTNPQQERTDWVFEAKLLRIAAAKGWAALGGVKLLGNNRDRAIQMLLTGRDTTEDFEGPIERRRRTYRRTGRTAKIFSSAS